MKNLLARFQAEKFKKKRKVDKNSEHLPYMKLRVKMSVR